MKIYNAPMAELIYIKAADVITLSADDDLAEFDDTVNAPSGWFNS